MADLPVACTLGPAALKARREGLLADLLQRAERRETLSDGQRWTFHPSDDVVSLIGQAINAERECCRFLSFRLTVPAAEGPIVLEVTGPEGTREFLSDLIASGGTRTPTSKDSGS
jgi:hypothetical protein